ALLAPARGHPRRIFTALPSRYGDAWVDGPATARGTSDQCDHGPASGVVPVEALWPVSRPVLDVLADELDGPSGRLMDDDRAVDISAVDALQAVPRAPRVKPRLGCRGDFDRVPVLADHALGTRCRSGKVGLGHGTKI